MTSARPLDRSTSAVTSRFSDHLRDLNRAQKSGAGVPAYTRWVNRRLARGVAAGAATIGLGPNAVTLISAAVSALGLILLVAVPPSGWSGVAVAALLAGGYVLDSADGQVARLTGRAGPAGEWLDHVVDAFRTPAIHLACAAATYVHRSEDVIVMLAAVGYAVLSTGQFMSQILAEQLAGRSTQSSGETGGVRKSLLLLPNDMGTLCWTFALWGLAPAFTVAYVAMFLVNGIHSLVSMRRKYVRLSELAPADTASASSKVVEHEQ